MAFSSALSDAIDMASKAYERQGGLSGISTGMRDLDRALGGLQRSDLVILAGRPSMGKTALATNLAFNVARAYRTQLKPDGMEEVADGAIVGFFSLEMSAEQLATRIISEQAQISSEKIRRGMINDDEFHRLVAATKELQSLPLFIDHTGGITIAQLAARARKLKRQRGLGLLVVDYLQLLAGSAKKAGEGRVQEVTEITTGLKALAKELDVPIIALSQLSRQVENREDKRPQLSDLRESGSIEQDADVVMFVFREEYYVQRAEPSITKVEEHLKWQDLMDQVQGIGEVIIGKQRHGPTGTVRLQFTAEFTRFSDLADDSRLPARSYSGH
jgi:replicative DNA helicase